MKTQKEFVLWKFLALAIPLGLLAGLTTVELIDFDIKLIGMIVMNMLAYMLVINFQKVGLFYVLIIYLGGVISITYTTRLASHMTNAVVAFQIAMIISVNYLYKYVSKSKKAMAALYEESVVDELTKVHNKRYFEYRIVEEINRAKRNDSKLALLVFDLDKFKNFNDTLGHKSGDELLRLLSKELKNSTRDNEVLCRYGGDEFVLILSDYEHEHRQKMIQRLDLIMESFSYMVYTKFRQQMTVSIGAAVYPDDAQEKEGLFKCADAAMYESKKYESSKLTRYTQALSKVT